MKLVSEKLLGYCVLTGAFLSTAADVSAQFTYKDYDPDSLIYPNLLGSGTYPDYFGSAKIDINQDGVNDFSINVFKKGVAGYSSYSSYSTVSSYVRVKPIGPNQIAIQNEFLSSYAFPDPCDDQAGALYFGDMIDNSLSWTNSTADIIFNGYAYCGGGLNTSQYLPVRAFLSGDWSYGWIRLRPTSSSTVLIQSQMLDASGGDVVMAGVHPEATDLVAPAASFGVLRHGSLQLWRWCNS